jgi:hypothetical protein
VGHSHFCCSKEVFQMTNCPTYLVFINDSMKCHQTSTNCKMSCILQNKIFQLCNQIKNTTILDLLWGEQQILKRVSSSKTKSFSYAIKLRIQQFWIDFGVNNHTLPPSIHLGLILMLSYHLCLSLPNGFFFQVF